MSYIYNSTGILAGLLGDRQIETLFSQEHDLTAMLRFEAALAEAQADVGFISDAAAREIRNKVQSLDVDLPALTARIAQDGVAPPGLVAQLRATLDSAHAQALHTGATSQDLVDTSLMMRLSEVVPILVSRLDDLQTQLTDLASPDAELMAHTRMQRALPISRGQKVHSWATPLKELALSAPAEFALQLGGPEGALNAMGNSPKKIGEHMARALGLHAPRVCWHTDRRRIVDVCSWACAVTTALGKTGQDIALMAQNEVAEVTLAGGGSSSAMAHKNNPIAAETLVAIARANATLMGGIHQAALHENDRSGAGWTLEFMLLPQIFVNAGAATRTAASLLGAISFT